jgi:hypothetical protein
MPTITFKSIQQGDIHIVLKDVADLSQLTDEAMVTMWAFENTPRTTRTLIRASDKMASYGLSKDADGDPNARAYNLAYTVCYLWAHCSKWIKGGITHEAPFTLDTVEDEIPESVLMEYFARSNPKFDWSAVIKKQGPPAGETTPTDLNGNASADAISESSGS